MDKSLIRLSKTLAHALRHDPDHYAITLDEEGWVALDDLVEGLKLSSPQWADVTAEMIRQIVREGDKPRYELDDHGQIRAAHGHSLDQKISYDPSPPPDLLYHGTPSYALEEIMKVGLKPMNRQYVHLASDEKQARLVGSRKRDKVVILKILAGQAHTEGIRFYQSNESVWLADEVPPRFITR